MGKLDPVITQLAELQDEWEASERDRTRAQQGITALRADVARLEARPVDLEAAERRVSELSADLQRTVHDNARLQYERDALATQLDALTAEQREVIARAQQAADLEVQTAQRRVIQARAAVDRADARSAVLEQQLSAALLRVEQTERATREHAGRTA